MLIFSMLAPYRGEIKTLRFAKDKNPLRQYGLGLVTDLDGHKWEMKGIMPPHIIARPYHEAVASGAYSTMTNAYCRGGRWIPYKVELHDPQPTRGIVMGILETIDNWRCVGLRVVVKRNLRRLNLLHRWRCWRAERFAHDFQPAEDSPSGKTGWRCSLCDRYSNAPVKAYYEKCPAKIPPQERKHDE